MQRVAQTRSHGRAHWPAVHEARSPQTPASAVASGSGSAGGVRRDKCAEVGRGACLRPTLDHLIRGKVDLASVELLAAIGWRQRTRIPARTARVRKRALGPWLAALDHLVHQAALELRDALLLLLLLEPLEVGGSVVARLLLLRALLRAGVGGRHQEEGAQQQGARVRHGRRRGAPVRV